MKPSYLEGALAAALALGCSAPAIPPPVGYPTTARQNEPIAAANEANADPTLNPKFGPFDVQTVFHIEKSNNKDRVDYGIRLDQHCAPVGDDAMFPYWRELERTPVKTHPLSFLQHMAYGIAEQRPLEKSRSGGKYLLELKQVERTMVIVTRMDGDSHCVATAFTKIQEVDGARLTHIFVKVAGVASADYVDVHGIDAGTGRALVERIAK